MRKFVIIYLSLFIVLLAYGQDKQMRFEQFDMHVFDGFISLNDSVDVHFKMIFNVAANEIRISNGDEIIKATQVEFRNDSLSFYIPPYESAVRLKLDRKISIGNFEGYWNKYPSKGDVVLPFYAVNSWSIHFPPYLVDEMLGNKKPTIDLNGKWKIDFKDKNGSSYTGIGMLKQDGNDLSGTIRTETGDYRFLWGHVSGNSFNLNCFDGAHCFRYQASVETEKIVEGLFYSGKNGFETFTGVRNDQAELMDPYLITKIINDTLAVNPIFRNAKGYDIELNDPQFDNKVVVLQIMGTWCPNCMDESKYLAELYDKYQQNGLEIIGLAYERDEYSKAITKLDRYKNALGINYPLFYAGAATKDEASKDFPMLTPIQAFPTLIVLDRNKKIQKIHTGFNGPATDRYVNFKLGFDSLIENLCTGKP